jgi:hypothetical protein
MTSLSLCKLPTRFPKPAMTSTDHLLSLLDDFLLDVIGQVDRDQGLSVSDSHGILKELRILNIGVCSKQDAILQHNLEAVLDHLLDHILDHISHHF